MSLTPNSKWGFSTVGGNTGLRPLGGRFCLLSDAEIDALNVVLGGNIRSIVSGYVLAAAPGASTINVYGAGGALVGAVTFAFDSNTPNSWQSWAALASRACLIETAVSHGGGGEVIFALCAAGGGPAGAYLAIVPADAAATPVCGYFR